VPGILPAQGNSTPPPPAAPTSVSPIYYDEDPPPVKYGGKLASELSDDEIIEFLQEKIKNITHEDRQVRLLRVSPSYPLSLQFAEPYAHVLLGDPDVVKVDSMDERTLVISASLRQGDTEMQVFFAGGKMRYYHIFIVENLQDAETAIKVGGFSSSNGASASNIGWMGGVPGGRLDIRTIAQVIRNYDALLMEKAIDPQMVKRTQVFRKSNITGFSTYYIYQFASNPAAITFAYKNPYPYPIRYDESRLRLAIGNVRYVPDYVSFNRLTLGPGEATSGFAVIANPVFKFNQPFELIWK